VPPSVLITGVSGFVGRHLVAAFQASLPEVSLIPTSRREGVTVGGLPATRLDWDAPDAVRRTLEALQPDAIIHLSAEAAVGRAAADPMAVWRSNFWQTIELAEIVRTRLPATLFAFVSSAAVYGLSARAGGKLDENTVLRPADPYGATKAAADLAIGEMALRGLKAVRLRPFNHTGPGQTADYAIPALARQVALIEAGRQKPVIRTGSLDSARDFLDVRDVCAAYIAIMRQADQLPADAVLNIASGQARRIGEVLDSLLRLSGVKATIEVEPARVRPNEIKSLCGDATAARTLLGWQPEIPFEETLSDTLDWWRGEIQKEA
jgi:GDP-4-dehydro-6-deoxy-D-mannose reductase